MEGDFNAALNSKLDRSRRSWSSDQVISAALHAALNGDYSIHLLLHFLFKSTQIKLKQNRCFWKCLQLSGAQKIENEIYSSLYMLPLFRTVLKSHIEVVDQFCNLSKEIRRLILKRQRNCLKWKQHTMQTQRIREHMEHILSSCSGGLREGQ